MKYKNKETGEIVDAVLTSDTVIFAGMQVPKGHWLLTDENGAQKPTAPSDSQFKLDYEPINGKSVPSPVPQSV